MSEEIKYREIKETSEEGHKDIGFGVAPISTLGLHPENSKPHLVVWGTKPEPQVFISLPCPPECKYIEKLSGKIIPKLKEIETLRSENERMKNHLNECLICGSALTQDEIDTHGGGICHLCDDTKAENAELREFKRRVEVAVNAECTCGGMGPNDKGVCDVCMVWHRTTGFKEFGLEGEE